MQKSETVASNRSVANSNQNQDVSPTDIYSYRTTSRVAHDMRVINNGMAVLYQRVDMIRRAQKTLELEDKTEIETLKAENATKDQKIFDLKARAKKFEKENAEIKDRLELIEKALQSK